MQLNIGSSVIKRESKGINDVENKLMKDGWERTGTVLGGRVRYYEQSGINITAVSGPAGTVILPSGPLRGAVFGEDAVSIGSPSTIGMGAKKSSKEKSTKPRNNEMT